jgi:dodecin
VAALPRNGIPVHGAKHTGTQRKEQEMKKGSTEESSVYKVIEIVGVSSESWEAATRAAVERASETLRDLRVAEVIKLDVTIEDGKVSRYRSRLSVSFKYEGIE